MAEGSKVRLVRCPKCDNLLQEIPNVPAYQCGGCGAFLQVQMKSIGIDGSSEKSYEERVKLGSEKSESDREIDGVEVKERGENSNSSSSSRIGSREVKEEKTMENWKRGRGTVDQDTDFDQIPNCLVPERDGMMGYRRGLRSVSEAARFSKSPYPDEGPSNHQSSSSGYGDPMKKQTSLGVPERIEYLEQDRAELLRQLEEIQFKLNNMPGEPKERVSVVERMVHQDPYYGVSHENWLRESSSRSSRASVHPSLQDNNDMMPTYLNGGREHVPVVNVNDIGLQKFYHPMHKPNEILGYGESFAPQIHGRDPNQLLRRYSLPPSHDYYSREYMGMDPDPVSSYPNSSFFHHPTCSCFQCYNKQWQGPKQATAAVISDRRFRDAPTNQMFYHVENPGTVGPPGYHAASANLNPPPLHTRAPHSLSRRSKDLDSGLDSFSLGRVEKETQTKRYPHRCTPVSGGAPFVTCYSCFELLQLPRKFLRMKKNKRKLQCGACSTVMLILLESKKLLVSAPSEIEEIPLEVNGGSVEVIKEVPVHISDHAKRHSVNSYSDDYGNSGYSYQSVDSENALSTVDQRLNLRDCEKLQETPSPSSVTDSEESPDCVVARRSLPKSAELPVKENISSPVPGSPLLEHFKYSSYQQQVTESEKSNGSKHIDQEEVMTMAPSKQNSVTTATEMEVSFDYTNTGISQDSEELSKDDEADVLINGYPVPERLIEKAEKLAGKIHPGQYWYDFRAGFWGVMGQPCMGVIPPKIKEFNYPMSKNCAGGNTEVSVNGRELHQKDLNLLASRGLPTTRNKSYIIEISGSVLDEDSGEELDGLGKLAPTIEKLKHGFGMRSPRIAA